MIANDNHYPSLAARAYCEVQTQLRLRGETSASAIFEATRAAPNMPEEACGGEIYDAMFLAVRQGFVSCNTHDAAGDSITIGSSTILTPVATRMQ